MITFEMGRPRPAPCNPAYIGSLACHGRGFALLDGRCRGVLRLDEELAQLETVPTDLKYSCICYDSDNGCYWAAADNNAATLYHLDSCFQELGRARISGLPCNHLCALSYDCCKGGLWLAFPDRIGFWDIAAGELTLEPCQGDNRLNLDIQALCGGYAVAYLENRRQFLELQCPDCGERMELCLPRGYSLEAILLREICPVEREHCLRFSFFLLLRKLGCRELYVLDCVFSCCGGGRPCPPHPPCPPCPPPCPGPCPCPPCPPPCPGPCPCPPCPPPKPRPCPSYEIMQSIALEEAGIAHILNAEGEKLQRAVADCDNLEDLLRVNESVRRTIVQITLLEGQLYSKLETVTDCLCDCHEAGCGDPCGCGDCPRPCEDLPPWGDCC